MRKALTLVVIVCIVPVSATAMTIAHEGAPAAAIVPAEHATAAEQQAVAELADYLGRIAGCEFEITEDPGGPAVYVGPTARALEAGIDPDALGREEWIVRTVGDDLIVVGGRPRGTLYAAYHLLEEVLGVHWWTPWDETVPERPNIELTDLDMHGQPVLRHREIWRTYAGEPPGAFAARTRLNGNGGGILARYGGRSWGAVYAYGPPSHVHTFWGYIPPDQYFETHPEYFSLIDGTRRRTNAQLCLTNQELRDLFVEKLRGYIAEGTKEAAQEGLPPPRLYSISHNDGVGACQCENCQAIAEREGSEAGPLLDFVNFIADAIADEHPDIYISTLAYQLTEKPPATIRPRDNVIIRLCDQVGNFTRSILKPENENFHDYLVQWAEIAPHLRIWDYAVSYNLPAGLPMPSVHTYQPDFQFYAEHNVEGVFSEFEFPVKGDMRDLKVWMMAKLLEDPYADYDELLATFTDGFYGPAGPMVREYLSALEAASEERISYISSSATLPCYDYLTLDFIREAHAIFERAEEAVADDEVRLQRIRHARMPLDRATVILFRKFTRAWVAEGNEPETIPLDRQEIADRYRQTWLAEMERRGLQHLRGLSIEEEISRYTTLPSYLPPPEKFADLPGDQVFEFPAHFTRNYRDIVQVVRDEDAESGITNRLEFRTTIQTDRPPVEQYKLPMECGLYDVVNRERAGSGRIEAEDVPGPGYHWYKIGTFEIGPSYYLHLLSWIVQVDIGSAWDPQHPDQKFDIWARVKFEGPAFPHGREDEPNAICLERVVLVKAKE